MTDQDNETSTPLIVKIVGLSFIAIAVLACTELWVGIIFDYSIAAKVFLSKPIQAAPVIEKKPVTVADMKPGDYSYAFYSIVQCKENGGFYIWGDAGIGDDAWSVSSRHLLLKKPNGELWYYAPEDNIKYVDVKSCGSFWVANYLPVHVEFGPVPKMGEEK